MGSSSTTTMGYSYVDDFTFNKNADFNKRAHMSVRAAAAAAAVIISL